MHMHRGMRKIYALSGLLLFTSVLPSAEMWTGQLLDANCVRQHSEIQKYEECTPAEATSSFVLQTSGQMLKLDANGDKKAVEAWREYMSSADRAVDPGARSRALSALIQGTVTEDRIRVDNLLLR
jgi:hypothetical protein